MAPTEYATQSGLIVARSEVSLISGTTTLQNDATDGWFELWLDLSDMTEADEYLLRVYEKVKAAGTKRTVFQTKLRGPYPEPLILPPLALMHGWDMTLQKIGSKFPAVATTAVSTTTVDNTTHTVAMPAGIAVGDLLVMILGWDFFAGPVTTTGWTFVLSESPASGMRLNSARRIADGTEGASQSVTTGNNTMMGAVCYRITGARSTGTFVEAATVSSTASAAADPPSLAPAAGSNDYLWLAAVALNDDTSAINTAPTNYSNLQTGDTGSVGTNGAKLLTAERLLAASSEDPAAFTGANSPYAGATIAVSPDDPRIDASIRKLAA